MTWTAGTPLKRTREGTWTYHVRAAYPNQVHLGEGGCGITYLADCLEGEHRGKRAVIKTILDEHYDRPDFLQIKNDFFAEALRVRGCIHSHIVQVWDVFLEPMSRPETQGTSLNWLVWNRNNRNTQPTTIDVPCMVQEYIEGQSLWHCLWHQKEDKWQPAPPLSEENALRYIQQIGSALAVVHGQQMAHRDVKPENIMLRQPEYEAVLIDFGLVRPINIKRHTAFRSDGYAPPEQYVEETDRDATLDVYAFAATLYVLVTGLDPVGDTRLVESKLRGSEQHMGRPDPLKRPEHWNPGISTPVSNAIWQGMALDPTKRPPTIADWLGLMGLSLENDRSPVLVQPRTPTWSDPLPALAIVNPPRTEKTVPASARLKEEQDRRARERQEQAAQLEAQERQRREESDRQKREHLQRERREQAKQEQLTEPERGSQEQEVPPVLPTNALKVDITFEPFNKEAGEDNQFLAGELQWINVQDLFLPRLFFVGWENAFLGGIPLNYDGPQPVYNGERITPILPLNEKLLNYLTPEDLNAAVKVQQTTVENGPGVRITLNLRLTGETTNGISRQDLSIQREFPLKVEHSISEGPVVELWPNFATPTWKTYYGFYYDGEFGSDTFQVIFPGAMEQERFSEAGNYLMARLEEFPSYIQCRNSNGVGIGLVLLPSPPLKPGTKTWKVGVDFGTSFTNVYVNGSQSGNKETTPLKIKNLHLQITDSQFELRSPVLFEYFLPEKFVPEEKPFPLRTILTHRGFSENTYTDTDTERPLFDGRILTFCNAEEFKPDPDADWIKTNLKWSIENLRYIRIFLKNLMLYISAIAAEEGVHEIIWSFSYPSQFSNSDKIDYSKVWKDIAKEVANNTGIYHDIPELDDEQRFRAESIATAQFFADFDSPKNDLLHATCIYIKDEISDISIWQVNELVHQCSVQLAGHDLFSQFLGTDKMRFLNEYLLENSNWTGLNINTTLFNAKLDVWLRLQADDWLQHHRDLLIENAKFQGLNRLICIGYAGLLYYVGIILKTLHREGKLNREEITPIYLGGNGSRFINWLVTGGSFTNQSDVKDVLIRVLTQGTWFLCPEALTLSQEALNANYYDFSEEQRGFKEIDVEIYLSPKPQDEVACGLVLNDTRLKGLTKREKKADILIAGERYKLHGEELGPDTRFDIKGNVSNFEMPTLPELQRFLYLFHKAIDELDPDEVTPLPANLYKPSLRAADNEALWRLTERRLLNTLTQMRQQSDESVRVEPPFILGLKALLQVLGEKWAEISSHPIEDLPQF